MQWVRSSFDTIMGAIGGFAGFWWGILAFCIGDYQSFEKDKSFVGAIYSYQDSKSKFDGVEEEELLDEYFLVDNLTGRASLQINYCDKMLMSWLCCLSPCFGRSKCWKRHKQ